MDIQSLQIFLAEPGDDTKRLKALQQQFASICHAKKCIKINTNSRCSFAICSKWRDILSHYMNCDSGYACTYRSCGSTRILIEHFNSCSKSDCRFCEPLKKFSTKKTSSTTIVCSNRQYSTAKSLTSNFAVSMSKDFSNDWGETSCTTQTTYFSTCDEDLEDEKRSKSYEFLTSCIRSPYRYGKTERIQRELIVMFHVQKCAELDHNDPSRQKSILCSVPHCSTMKRTLIHVAICQDDHCTFPDCEITRTIIQHWLRCSKRHCEVCAPVLDSIPAIDGESHYKMDEKLLGLLYIPTQGLSDITVSDLSPYEEDWSCNVNFCFQNGSVQSCSVKQGFTNDDRISISSSSNKRQRTD